MDFPRLSKQRRSVKASSTAVSTVILTGTLVVLVSVAFVYVNQTLNSNIAQSDFNSAKQFMQTIGLQTDDVAWTLGRTETVRYSSRYGDVTVLPQALNYTIYVNTTDGSGYRYFATETVDALLFSISTSEYNLFNGYHEQIFPLSATNLTLKGTSAPVVRVFAVEELSAGNYLRIVVAPSIRVLFSNITTVGNTTRYAKLYLPVLKQGDAPRKSQSVTVSSDSITLNTVNNVSGINVTVTFPNQASGFSSSFFGFPGVSEVIEMQGYDDTILELYTSEVTVGLGTNL